MTGPKLGYFDMNGAVEVFTQRAVTLHKRQWDTAVTVPLHWTAERRYTLRTLCRGSDLVATSGPFESAQPWFKKVPEL